MLAGRSRLGVFKRVAVGERLAAFKVPVKIVFAPDALPRKPTGKLMKWELKQLFDEQKA